MGLEKLKKKLKEVIVISERLKDADFTICMTTVLKDICLELGFESDKLEILGNRVNLKRFKPTEQINYDKDTIRVLFTGRLQPQKNLHGVTKALSILKTKGWKVHIDILGYNFNNGYLEESVSCLEEGEYQYHGAKKNRKLPKFYSSIDIYAGPSFFEGFQIPLIEALASGKPCVASDLPPSNEIISNDVGSLVNPEEPESIAEGILRLKEILNDTKSAKAIRERCREDATKKWSYMPITTKEADIYLKLLQK